MSRSCSADIIILPNDSPCRSAKCEPLGDSVPRPCLVHWGMGFVDVHNAVVTNLPNNQEIGELSILGSAVVRVLVILNSIWDSKAANISS